MTLKSSDALSLYCNLSDTRGEFQGIVNYGSWQEVNIVSSRACTTRGGHYHRNTTEVIFLLKGKAEVELAPCDHLADKVRITLTAGKGLRILPMTAHTFYYSEDSTHLQLLDLRFDPTHQDLISINAINETSTNDSTDSTLD